MAENVPPGCQARSVDDDTDVRRVVSKEIIAHPLIDGLKETHLRRGVLIPLKTTQEVRQDHLITQAVMTRAPTKSANDVIMFVSLLRGWITLTCPGLCATCILTAVLTPCLICAAVPNHWIYLLISRHH